MTSYESDNISVVLKYFHDGCNSGDLDVLLSTLDPDVVAIEGKDGALHEEALRYARARSGKR